MSPEHLTVLRALLDDKTPAPLTYNEAVLVEYIKWLAKLITNYAEDSYIDSKLHVLLEALRSGGF